ncbi:zinc finger protein 62-like isoform X2 [Aricia agestis]|uniref:zinc finger protein 62-like isoform X2 n=1 Tax=Aricia agestis TaxID=91739 RepID=UPI001C206C5A|nr:zinc finger protein 62-like isoform X2 [Aricia agestis]
MEFQETVVKDSPGLCRCCLSEGCYKELGAEYTWFNETEIYADMLLDCFDISISQHVDGPNGPNRLICEVCITRLRDACEFKKQVLESEKKFINMVCKGEFSKTVLVYKDPVKVELKDNLDTEYLDEDLDLDNDDLPEKIEIETPLDNADLTASVSAVKKKRGRPKKTLTEEEKPTPKKAKLEDKPRTSKDKFGPEIKIDANKLTHRSLQNLFTCTTILPFEYNGRYRCFYCGEEQTVYNDIKVHTLSHKCIENDQFLKIIKCEDNKVKVDVSEIKCLICEETFENSSTIITHLKIKHKKDCNKDITSHLIPFRLIDLKCLNCSSKFKNIDALIGHDCKKRLINDRSNSDGGDSKLFSKKIDLDVNIPHRAKYVCTKCTISFSTFDALEKHNAEDHIVKCDICFRVFLSDRGLSKHIKNDHTPQQDKPNTVSEIRSNVACIFNMSTIIPFKYFTNRFKCFYCGKQYNESLDLREHTVVEHPVCDVNHKCMSLRGRLERPLKIDTSVISCKLCHTSMQDVDSLIDHLMSEHEARYDKSVDNNLQPFKLIKDKYPCPICEEEHLFFGKLLSHMSQEHSENKHLCMHCGRSFRSAPGFRFHVRNCRGTTVTFKCDVCNLECSSKNILQRHLGNEHDIKRIKCNVCGEKFTARYALNRHMIDAHDSGNVCQYCGKQFPGNYFLVDHVEKIHLKEKGVKCEMCDKSFYDAKRLKNHMVKHQETRVFRCDVCGKPFRWKKNLKGHMNKHHNNFLAD